jgi:hypothetical protein
MKNTIRIVVKGLLDKKWEGWFDGMQITWEGENTVLSGNIKDKAFVHGILDKIRDLNLNLISVNPSDEKEY